MLRLRIKKGGLVAYRFSPSRFGEKVVERFKNIREKKIKLGLNNLG